MAYQPNPDPATQTTLALIKAKTDNIPPLGQALAAASVPVILPSATVTTLTPPAAITGFATSAKQDTLLTELQLKADLTETQPVSLASVPSHAVTNAGTFAVQADTELPAAAALADGVSSVNVEPRVAADMQGLRSDGTANSDRAILSKMQDVDSGAGTEYAVGVSKRVAASGGSIAETYAAGAVAPGTQRMTLGSDDPAVTALQIIDNMVSGSGVNISQINGVAPLMGNGVTGTGSPRVTIASDTSSNTSPFYMRSPFSTRADTFTTTANGTTVNVATTPMKFFGIQVTQTGAVTSWDVRLEGSLDNVSFSTILTHTNVTGSGAVLWLTTPAPSLYFRSRCSGLVLGAGTNVIATILGQD